MAHIIEIILLASDAAGVRPHFNDNRPNTFIAHARFFMSNIIIDLHYGGRHGTTIFCSLIHSI